MEGRLIHDQRVIRTGIDVMCTFLSKAGVMSDAECLKIPTQPCMRSLPTHYTEDVVGLGRLTENFRFAIFPVGTSDTAFLMIAPRNDTSLWMDACALSVLESYRTPTFPRLLAVGYVSDPETRPNKATYSERLAARHIHSTCAAKCDIKDCPTIVLGTLYPCIATSTPATCTTLQEHRERVGHLPSGFTKMCLDLFRAHYDYGFSHNNLHLNNVLVDSAGVCQIIDYGNFSVDTVIYNPNEARRRVVNNGLSVANGSFVTPAAVQHHFASYVCRSSLDPEYTPAGAIGVLNDLATMVFPYLSADPYDVSPLIVFRGAATFVPCSLTSVMDEVKAFAVLMRHEKFHEMTTERHNTFMLRIGQAWLSFLLTRVARSHFIQPASVPLEVFAVGGRDMFDVTALMQRVVLDGVVNVEDPHLLRSERDYEIVMFGTLIRDVLRWSRFIDYYNAYREAREPDVTNPVIDTRPKPVPARRGGSGSNATSPAVDPSVHMHKMRYKSHLVTGVRESMDVRLRERIAPGEGVVRFFDAIESGEASAFGDMKASSGLLGGTRGRIMWREMTMTAVRDLASHLLLPGRHTHRHDRVWLVKEIKNKLRR